LLNLKKSVEATVRLLLTVAPQQGAIPGGECHKRKTDYGWGPGMTMGLLTVVVVGRDDYGLSKPVHTGPVGCVALAGARGRPAQRPWRGQTVPQRSPRACGRGTQRAPWHDPGGGSNLETEQGFWMTTPPGSTPLMTTGRAPRHDPPPYRWEGGGPSPSGKNRVGVPPFFLPQYTPCKPPR